MANRNWCYVKNISQHTAQLWIRMLHMVLLKTLQTNIEEITNKRSKEILKQASRNQAQNKCRHTYPTPVTPPGLHSFPPDHLQL